MKSFYVWVSVLENWGDDEHLGNFVTSLIDGGFDVKRINKEQEHLAFKTNYGDRHLFHVNVITEDDEATTGKVRHIVSQLLSELEIQTHSLIVSEGNIDASWELTDDDIGSVKAIRENEGIVPSGPKHCETCSTQLNPMSKSSLCRGCQDLGYTPTTKYVQCETCNIELRDYLTGYCSSCYTGGIQAAKVHHNEVCVKNREDIIQEIAEKQEAVKTEKEEKKAKAEIKTSSSSNGSGKAITVESLQATDLSQLIRLVEKTVGMSDIFFDLTKVQRKDILDSLKGAANGY